jgi:hypothetical protein
VFNWIRTRSRRLRRTLRRKVFVLSVARDWIAAERALHMGLNPLRRTLSLLHRRRYGCKECGAVFEVGGREPPFTYYCINCRSSALVYFNIAGLYSSTGERLRDWLEGRNHGKEEDQQGKREIRLVAKDGSRLY